VFTTQTNAGSFEIRADLTKLDDHALPSLMRKAIKLAQH
jgi:hypothetical protein